MPLAPGSQIGPYTVVGPLGAGGMGEVYRARDARLKRDVALKVLPPSAVGDPDRRRRFEREAQVLASLSHPAIAQVFGVEIDGDAPIIVMELVEGSTLADRLAKGALPLDEALAIALQLCDGLEAAHERNVIHRDLKPANIKVRSDGTIKILDFGIARVLTSDESVDTSNWPTLPGGGTDAGMILGTAAYMSPEQARGRVVDKRTDVWAFGCILYEMLTGASVYSGQSTTDILAEVVKTDPDWSRLPAAVPERLVELLKRCLEKNPKDRLRDIADARFEIARASRTPAARTSDAGRGQAIPRSASWLRSIGWFAVGAATAAALLFIALPLGRDTVAPPAPVRTTIALPPDTTLALSRGSAVALSPDGQTLVFTGRSHGKTQLYARSLDRFESQPLPGTEDASNPFFSPDGRWVGFFADGKLKKVSLDGGAPVTVADALNPRGDAWGVDDMIYVTSSNNAPVSRVAARGGKLEPFTTLAEGQLSHRWPELLPDGRTLLFAVWNDSAWDSSRIVAQRADGGSAATIVDAGGGYPHYIRDAGRRGYLVYARTEGLLAAPFDEASLALTGQAVPVIDGVITNLSGGAHFDLSSSGTLAYVPGALGESERELVWVARDGKAATPPVKMRGLTFVWQMSPDGTRVTRATGGDVFSEDLATRQVTRVTDSPDLRNFSGVWSSDGKSVIFGRGLGNTDLFRRAADGRGVEERLTSSLRPKTPIDVSRDGHWLTYNEVDPNSNSDIWVLPLPPAGSLGSSGKVPEAKPLVKTRANEGYAVFSPDGKWIAYQSNDSGRFEIFIRSFPDGQQAFRVSADGGIMPMWSPSGSELFYRDLSNQMVVVVPGAGGSFEGAKPRVLFDAVGYDNSYAVSPDGQRLLMMPLLAAEQSATQVNLVLNFLTELRQRVR